MPARIGRADRETTEQGSPETDVEATELFAIILRPNPAVRAQEPTRAPLGVLTPEVTPGVAPEVPPLTALGEK